jgi:hypothetical protein
MVLTIEPQDLEWHASLYPRLAAETESESYRPLLFVPPLVQRKPSPLPFGGMLHRSR